MADPETVNVRYLVEDVAASVDFYTRHFGFSVGINSPAFADVTRGNLRLLLSGPKSSAGRAMSDGEVPGPGGWNRIHLIVDDIHAEVDRLAEDGVTFRNEIVTGPGGAQVLAVDPSGNLVELFQPAAELSDLAVGVTDPPSRLARRLGVGDAVTIGLGSMIGAGMFAALGPAADAAGSGLLIGLAIAGGLAFCNATSSCRPGRDPPGIGRHLRVRPGPARPDLGLPRRLGVRRRQDRQLRGHRPHVRRLRLARAGSGRRRSPRSSASPRSTSWGVRKTALLTRVIVAIVLGALALVVAGCPARRHGLGQQPR